MSDNPDGRTILASLPAYYGPDVDDVGVPLAAQPCLWLEAQLTPHEGLWLA